MQTQVPGSGGQPLPHPCGSHCPQTAIPDATHTSKEAQPLGQDVCSFGLDEDFAAVEGNTGAHFPADIKHGWFLQEKRQEVTPALCRVPTSHCGLPYDAEPNES